MPAHHAKRQDESDIAVGKMGDGDRRPDASALPDMLLPGREPVERLEGGAIGGALELPPFGFDRAELAENAKSESRPDVACPLAMAGDCGGTDVDRCGHVMKRRQCRGAYHSTH